LAEGGAFSMAVLQAALSELLWNQDSDDPLFSTGRNGHCFLEEWNVVTFFLGFGKAETQPL